MSSFRKHISIGIFAAAAAGLSWAMATGMVINHPATITFQINYNTVGGSSETLNTIRVEAYPEGGAYPAAREQPGGAGLRTIPLIVDGGDPDEPADLGVKYETRAFGFFARPHGTSYLRIIRPGRITLDNNAGSAPAAHTIEHAFVQTRRANVSVTAQGAQIVSYSIYANASATSPIAEQYLARTYYSAGPLSNAISSWLTMPPQSSVQIYGSVVLQYADGSRVTHSLPSQFKNLSSGDADVVWNLDVRNSGRLSGDIALELPAGATPASYTLFYESLAPSPAKLQGSLAISTTSPHYELDLPPATYAFHLRVTYAGAAGHVADTPDVNRTITPGANAPLGFTNRFGAATSALQISGFFNNEDISDLQSQLHLPTKQTFVISPNRSGEAVSYFPPYGSWRLQQTTFDLKDLSNPLLPLDIIIKSTHSDDPALPLVPVDSAQPVSFGSEALQLVKSDVYFDVADGTGGPALISKAEVQAVKYVYNADGRVRRYLVITAYGSTAPRSVSGLTIAAEPGVYAVSARAKVNGQMTVFRGNTLTFGAPTATPTGSPSVPIADDPAHPERLKITLGFQNVTAPGLTTVVETALGPEPPEGFRTSCSQDPPDDDGDGVPDAGCDPVYYDITSNATWQSQTKVCIRRRSTLPNRVVEDGLLALFHYETSAATWQRLPAPSDGTPAAFDCSADLAVCGCASEAECGIDQTTDPDHPINVFQLCGMTTSFSPFAVLQSTVALRRKK